MNKMKYLIKRIFKMDYTRMFKTINEIHKRTNKNRIILFFDIIVCAFKYKSGYVDYSSFGFYDLNAKQRKTFLTRGKNNAYVAKLNQKDKWYIFDEKNEFNKKFDKFLKRDWIYLDNNLEEFKKMISNKKSLIVKPNNNSGGVGVEKIDIKDFENTENLYNYLIQKKQLLIEEVICQHKELNRLHPTSVNTIRIITIRQGNCVDYVTAFLRIGNGKVVDNTCSGGMLTMIDLKTGKTLYPACDAALNVYEKHPITDVEISGFQLPFWKESLKLTEELAKIVDGVNYIAWDIAITDNGPVVVEGNPYPGYYYQFPIHTPNKIGVVPIFEKILNKTKED